MWMGKVGRGATGAGIAGAPPRRRHADRLHVGNDGEAERSRAHPRVPPGRCGGAADGVGVDAGQSCTAVLPLFHVHGLCAGLFGTLAAGGAAVVFDRFEEEAIMRAVHHHDHVLRGPHVSPPRPDGAGIGAGAAASASRARRPYAPDLWHRLAEEGVPVLERSGMTETLW